MIKPSPTPMVKICGLTRPNDAVAAKKSGADWLGLILVPNTPRALTLAQARAVTADIAERRFVAVFQNAALADMLEAAAGLPVLALQLHGEESAELARELWQQGGVRVFKKLTLDHSLTQETLLPWLALHADGGLAGLLLEPPKPLPLADSHWQILEGLATVLPETLPVFLAGGLTPLNVGDACRRAAAIGVQCTGVDVATGVEAAPGIKDPMAMTRFVLEAKACNR